MLCVTIISIITSTQFSFFFFLPNEPAVCCLKLYVMNGRFMANSLSAFMPVHSLCAWTHGYTTHQSIRKIHSQLIFSYQQDIKEPWSIAGFTPVCSSWCVCVFWGVGGLRGIHLKESEYTGVWGASFCALLHGAIMEWVIQPSGKCSIRRQRRACQHARLPLILKPSL